MAPVKIIQMSFLPGTDSIWTFCWIGKSKKLDFRYRLRFQSTDPNIMSDAENIFESRAIRHKIAASHKIAKKTWGWATFEVWTQQIDNTIPNLTDWRVKWG